MVEQPDRDAVRALAARLDVEPIVDAVLARFRKEVPGYERISYELDVQLRETIARNIDLAMQTMVQIVGNPIELLMLVTTLNPPVGLG